MTRKIPARLKLSVHWVDGHWEFALGGAVPVRAGAGAELVIASSQISDVDFLKRVTQEVAVQFLPEGTDLLVALTPRSPDGQRMLGVPTLDHVRALAADSAARRSAALSRRPTRRSTSRTTTRARSSSPSTPATACWSGAFLTWK